MSRDISITDEGSLVVQDGDFVLVEPEETDRQVVNVRLRTTNPDFYYEPDVGGDLETLVGMPNEPGTGQAGEELIRRALTFDERFAPSDFLLSSMPTGFNSILFALFIERSRTLADHTPVAIGLYLKSGVTV